MIYTGVGARKTPPEWLHVLTVVARTFAAAGWTLRSGNAAGGDQAFQAGAGEAAEIYLPWPSYEGGRPEHVRECHARPTMRAWEIAREHHPAWERLTRGGRLLQARNSHEVLGVTCDDPSDVLICWTPGARGGGGTGQAIRVARAYGVPVVDLGSAEGLNVLASYVPVGT